jgi:hypothetical protein
MPKHKKTARRRRRTQRGGWLFGLLGESNDPNANKTLSYDNTKKSSGFSGFFSNLRGSNTDNTSYNNSSLLSGYSSNNNNESWLKMPTSFSLFGDENNTSSYDNNNTSSYVNNNTSSVSQPFVAQTSVAQPSVSQPFVTPVKKGGKRTKRNRKCKCKSRHRCRHRK